MVHGPKWQLLSENANHRLNEKHRLGILNLKVTYHSSLEEHQEGRLNVQLMSQEDFPYSQRRAKELQHSDHACRF